MLPRTSTRALMTLAAGAGLSTLTACPQPVVTGTGQFGAPIARITDANGTPRLLVSSRQDEQAAADPGPCSAVCLETPHQCTASGTCSPALLDSGSPFSILVGEELSTLREPLEVRRGTPDELERSVVRFRFEDAPIIRVPDGFSLGGWDWSTGSTTTGIERVGAVIGGNILRHFAVRISPTPTTVAFYEQFPGSEAGLADLGWVFARLAYPNRLVGMRPDDTCRVEELSCDLARSPFIPNARELGFEPTRMMVDACFAPPPCAPDWVDVAGSRSTCDLRRGDETGGCRAADDPEFGGKGAAFVVATGSPGMILFEDSLERMFGGTPLPTCSERLTATHAICDTGERSFVAVPGYAPIPDARLLRVRALALVDGTTIPAGPGPCTRLRRRLSAARLSCQGLDERDQPFRSLRTTEIDPETHAVVIGETRWGDERESDVNLWLDFYAVPETSPLAQNLRREVGSDAIEPDGLLGTTLLEHSELVLDYTEAEDAPGVRVGCLSGAPSCLALPACSGVDGTEGPGRGSCCHGMPQDLILSVLARDAEAAAPCCNALDAQSLAVVQTTGICLDTVER
jgi:hypothetical protein